MKNKSAFTLVEVLISLAIGTLMVLLVLSNIVAARSQAINGQAVVMQNRIVNIYENWSALGGTHSSSNEDEATLCLNLLKVLSGNSDEMLIEGSGDNVVSDGPYGKILNSSSIRFLFPISECSIEGEGVDYDDFHLTFSPLSGNKGVFSVSSK